MTTILQVRDLSVRFGMVTAADDLTVTVRAGELVGIIGPNGAGKTTLLNLITGYVRPQGGSIRVLGRDIVGLPPQRITALGVGRSFQTPQLFVALTALENVMIALATAEGRSLSWWAPLRQPARIGQARAILDRFGLQSAGDHAVAAIAEGARKLLDVALAFALRPQLLLMDEPTSGVSADEKFEVMDTVASTLREEGITAVFVEHDMDVVRRYADRVLVLSDGRIAADGPPGEVLTDDDVRRSVAGWG